MGDVIDMHSRQKQEKASEDRVAATARRASMLREALKAKSMFETDDQRRAAANFHALLEQFERERRLRKLDVAVRAGLCNHAEVESTKRLDTYTLPENATQKRINRLAKKVDKYFQFADVVGTLTGESVNSLICRIFEGCSFGSSSAKGPDWNEDRWIRLANLIEAMSRRVIRDTDLAAYWRDVLMLQGGFDVRSMSFRQYHAPIGYGAASRGLAGMVQCSDEIAPVPSIPILRRLQAPKRKGRIALCGNEPEQVDVILFLEVRLALAPTNAATKLGPLLEFRSVLEAIHERYGWIRFDNPFTDGSDVVREAITDVGRFPVEIIEWPETPDAERRDGCEHSYFAWEEVSPAALSDILGFAPDKVPHRRDDLWHYCVINRNCDTRLEELPPSPFAESEPAECFYIDLITGQIESELAGVCRELIAGLEAHKAELSERILAAESAALRRWATDSVADGDQGEPA